MVKKKFKKTLKEKAAGSFVHHTSCPKCGSSNNLAVYHHEEDGSHSATCWGGDCGKSYIHWDLEGNCPKGSEARDYDYEELVQEETYLMNLPSFEEVKEVLEAASLPDRKIPESILEFYGVKVDRDDSGEIYRYFYPTWRDGKHVGYRPVSRIDKGNKILEKKPNMLGKIKDFSGVIGDTKKGIELFGQHLFKPEEHKRIFITEGEVDAMTGYMFSKMTTKNKLPYAFVSMPSGANIAGLKPQLEWIARFEEIYLCFDDDDAGKDLLAKALKLLPVGKVKIVTYPEKSKDLNELWQKDLSKGARDVLAKQLYKRIWDAEKYSPAGIKTFSEGWSSYLDRGTDMLIPFPASFGELNKRTFGGYGLGEITNIAAPSSVGKSSFIKEMIMTALEETPYNIGILSFEETLDEFIEGLLSVEMSVQLNEIPLDMRDRQAEHEAFERIVKKGTSEGSEIEMDRIKFVDHQGACNGEQLMDKIDFLIKGLDCKMIILDPVTLALSGQDTSEDDFASDLVKIVKSTKIAWVNVHHVRKSSGGAKANSEGAELSEEDIKGSGVWFQTAMNNVMLMRDKSHSNDIVRNTTKIKLTKCRRHGKNTGVAGFTYYNGETGRLELGQDPTEVLEALEAFDQIEEGNEGKDEW